MAIVDCKPINCSRGRPTKQHINTLHSVRISVSLSVGSSARHCVNQTALHLIQKQVFCHFDGGVSHLRIKFCQQKSYISRSRLRSFRTTPTLVNPIIIQAACKFQCEFCMTHSLRDQYLEAEGFWTTILDEVTLSIFPLSSGVMSRPRSNEFSRACSLTSVSIALNFWWCDASASVFVSLFSENHAHFHSCYSQVSKGRWRASLERC